MTGLENCRSRKRMRMIRILKSKRRLEAAGPEQRVLKLQRDVSRAPVEKTQLLYVIEKCSLVAAIIEL
jgi:hypothetical protein